MFAGGGGALVSPKFTQQLELHTTQLTAGQLSAASAALAVPPKERSDLQVIIFHSAQAVPSQSG